MSLVELIRACAETNDGGAWEEFVARTQRPISLSIRHTAMQWGKDPQQYIEDLLQETYLKLCANRCGPLMEFAKQHAEEAVMGYIKTIAINLARDYFKGLHSKKRGGGGTDQLPDPARLEAKARADLLDGNADAAIKSLQRALEDRPDVFSVVAL
jgi:RNA polymerase sigma-70 factor (ECF subfamily)